MELSPAQMEKEWRSGKFRPVYYFFGEEATAKSSAARLLKSILKPDAFNLNEFSSEANSKIDDIVSTASTLPMFSNRRLIIVKSPKLGIETKKDLAQYLADPLDSTTLVLFSDERKPDIRDMLTAAAAACGGIVLFRPLNKEEAALRLVEACRKAGVSLGMDAADVMVSEAGTDWGILEGEIRKLLAFTRGRKEIRSEDVFTSLGYRETLNPFDLSRTLQTRERMRTLQILQRLITEGTDPFWILHQISTTINKQFKAKRMSKAGVPEAQILRELRLNPYYDNNFLRWASRIRDTHYQADMKACVKTETSLKSKAWLDPAMELESLAIRVCRAYAFGAA